MINDSLVSAVTLLENLRDNVVMNHSDAVASINTVLNDAYGSLNTAGIFMGPFDKREEPRDPGETEQHRAERLGLVPAQPVTEEPVIAPAVNDSTVAPKRRPSFLAS